MPLSDSDYAALAEFRHALRRFQAFSEAEAAGVGLTPQQHQALLAIRAAESGRATVGLLAERLIMKPHSASGLVQRLEALGLVQRMASPEDGRVALLRLTVKADELLERLSAVHREEIKKMRPLLATIFRQLG